MEDNAYRTIRKEQTFHKTFTPGPCALALYYLGVFRVYCFQMGYGVMLMGRGPALHVGGPGIVYRFYVATCSGTLNTFV